jgi:hypothetical protein
MTQIAVSDELARAFAEAAPPIVIVDRQGRSLGKFTPAVDESVLAPGMSKEFSDELRRRMNTPGEYSTLDEMKKRLGWPS